MNYSCSVDSLLNILGSAAADSDYFHKFLSSLSARNSTGKFVFSMLNTKERRKIYQERIQLLFPHFKASVNNLIDGLTLIDAMDTITSTATRKTLLKGVPSYTKISKCTNVLCKNISLEHSYEVIIFTAIDGKINIQHSIHSVDSFIETKCIECQECQKSKFITVNIEAYVIN